MKLKCECGWECECSLDEQEAEQEGMAVLNVHYPTGGGFTFTVTCPHCRSDCQHRVLNGEACMTNIIGPSEHKVDGPSEGLSV